jgi:hypothetical protein
LSQKNISCERNWFYVLYLMISMENFARLIFLDLWKLLLGT